VTTLASIPQQSYVPQTAVIPFTVGAEKTRIKVTLTRVAWPTGLIATALVDFGGLGSGAIIEGGGAQATMTAEVEKAIGVTSGEVTVVVYQTITTAILVEAF
jgi:hypothetical protein